jgi:thiamine biosynthesis protein ThiC
VTTYAILRRRRWEDGEAWADASARSVSEVEHGSHDLAWIRSYVLEECDGSVGTVCIYEAASPEAVRRHAAAAEIPVDEIVRITETLVVRPEPL